MSGTMAEKVWRDHIVSKGEAARPTCCTSTSTWCMRSRVPGLRKDLRLAGRKVRRPDLTIATEV